MLPARLLLFALALLASGARAEPAPTFLVVADTPYVLRDLPRLARLLANNADVDFVAHLGDIKSGAGRCDDARYEPVIALFAKQPRPLIFSPGDNDWTDCRRPSAGGHDPAERLAHLRQRLYADPSTLRLAELAVQRAPLPDPPPEIFWFRRHEVVFISWHVVGSYNNRYPRDKAAMAEYRERRLANHAVMQAALTELRKEDRAVVVLQHANPGMRRQRPHPGYQGMLDDLTTLLATTRVPVLLVHGDTHNFQFDQPWQDRPNGARLWRLEVPGYPYLAGIRVQVGDDPAQPFVIAHRAPEDPAP